MERLSFVKHDVFGKWPCILVWRTIPAILSPVGLHYFGFQLVEAISVRTLRNGVRAICFLGAALAVISSIRAIVIHFCAVVRTARPLPFPDNLVMDRGQGFSCRMHRETPREQ